MENVAIEIAANPHNERYLRPKEEELDALQRSAAKPGPASNAAPARTTIDA